MSDLRYRTTPRGQVSKSEVASSTANSGHDRSTNEHAHDEHEHEHEIDETKLDNLLWEISKFCIPIGAFLWISIYLCYRHELLDWFARTHPSRTYNPGRPLSRSLHTAVPSSVDAPSPSAPYREGDEDRFERWVEKETEVAWKEMAANIGPEQGAGEGIVVAALSKGEWEDEPDYHVS